MNKDYILLAFTIIGTLVFNFLFWQEKLGINVLLFDLLMCLMIFKLRPNVLSRKGIVMTGGCTLILALCIMINNSNLSKIIHSVSFCGFLGFVHFKELTFIGDAIVLGASTLFEAPMKAIRNSARKTIGTKNTVSILKWFKLGLIPFFMVSIFYAIYSSASPKFTSLASEAWKYVSELLIPTISITHLLFFIVGFLIVCGVLLPSYSFGNYTKSTPLENLDRNRIRSAKLEPSKKNLSLKSEYRIAWLVIISLNLLLFLVNLIDVRYVWFDRQSVTPAELSNYVHEGTYLLIVAILLAMAVVLYYFRRNLNFYPKNQNLIWCTYLRIGQNVVLTISVAVRNVQYVEYYGLAYKRLGVFMFLILVLIGLVTMYLKVKEKKSLYYLINRNVWAAYFAFVMVALINWDVVITKYNITAHTQAKIDVSYLMKGLSDKNIYLLINHKSDLINSLGNNGYYETLLDAKLSNFRIDQDKLTWRSWNYCDYRNKKIVLK